MNFLTDNTASERFFILSYMMFIFSQFFIPFDKIWDLIFYIFLIPTGIWVLLKNKDQINLIFSLTEIKIICVLIAWLCLTLFWHTNFSYDLAIDSLNDAWRTFAFIVFSLLFFIKINSHQNDIFWFIGIFVAAIMALASMTFSFETLGKIRLFPLGQLEQAILGASVYGLFGLAALHYSEVIKLKWGKLLCFSAFIIIALLIFFTISRGPILAFVISALFLWFWHEKKLLKLIFIIAAIAVISLVIYMIPDLKEAIFEYIQGALNRGASYRIEVWSHTINQILINPIIGSGIDPFFDLNIRGLQIAHPHNMFLGVLLSGGIIAGTLFSSLFILISIKAIKIIKTKEISNISNKLTFTFILYILLSTITDNAYLIIGPSPLWTIFWLPLIYAVVHFLLKQKITQGKIRI